MIFLLLLLQEKPDLQDRWVYCSYNLWVDKNLETLEDVMRRAAKSGYNGILLADSKFGKLGDMDERYFRNVARVKKTAAELGLEIVPAVFPVGYSESILWHDPNLAEALPVVSAPFEVRDGEARLVPDQRDLAKPSWKDDTVSADWTVTDPRGKNARIVFQLAVEPFRQYHVSARVRTKDFRGTPRIQAIGRVPLVHSDLGVKSTQDWTVHHAVFNSLEHREVNVYFGCWDGKTGVLEWKDLVFEEVGLLNVVRRDGAPLRVERDGKALAEGADFERVVDPRMGTVPWKGGYEVWHDPPPIRTNLPDGTKLRVSYHHVVTIHDGQVMICPSEPKTVELLRDQAKRMHAAWGANAYFMSHDEIRCLNWDEACTRRKLDAGAILADNVKTCAGILREVNPKGRIYVWSDMFDPHHNARKDYYLVRGDLAGSWEGLDKDVIVACWYFEKRAESMKWFAERGHAVLMAGYYDGDPEANARGWLGAAGKAARGIMYTTWRGDYRNLERFAEFVKQ
jgi:hypothetical protein